MSHYRRTGLHIVYSRVIALAKEHQTTVIDVLHTAIDALELRTSCGD